MKMQQTRSSSIDDLTDDLLELVLLHIPSRVGLVRSAAVCRPWRRLIASAGFLRRFCSLHGPRLLGHYNFDKNCKPYFIPIRMPPGDEAPINVSDRLRFLPLFTLSNLVPSDSRGGLLALCCPGLTVIVCNPCTMEFKELLLPWFNLCSGAMVGSSYVKFIGAFLLDAEDETATTLSNFKVLCVHLAQPSHDEGKKAVLADVYSAPDDRWIHMSRTLVGDDIPDILARNRTICLEPLLFLGRAGFSLCWSTTKRGCNGVFHLNMRTGEFSSIPLPKPADDVKRRNSRIYYSRWTLRVIGSRDNTGASVRLARIVGDDLEVLWYGHNATACVVEARVCLSRLCIVDKGVENLSWRFLETAEAAAPGRIVLAPRNSSTSMFVFDVNNMKLVSTHERNYGQVDCVLPYEQPWPPIKIEVCL